MPTLRDPEAGIESAMENALRPGRFIAYNESFDFVRGLREVATRLETVVRDGRAAAALEREQGAPGGRWLL